MEVKACRCCLSPGIHKDLNTTYMWLNNSEVYSEMLQECFNIALKMSDHTSSAICEECIKLLRRSCNFKRQVLHNEQELLRTLSEVQKKDEKPKELKFAQPLEDDDESEDYFLSDEDEKSIEVKCESSLDDKDDPFLSEEDKAEEEVKASKSSKQPLDEPKVFIDIEELRKLISVVIEHSTMMPFRWYCNKYMCFFCYDPFCSSQDLRQHTATEHKKFDLYYVLKNINTTTKIKFDVTDIMCKKCGQKLDSMTDFFDHVTEDHDVKLKKELSVHLSAYKLSDDGMFCDDCGQKFLFFGTLLSHINRFHAKTKMFLCETCGRGFTSRGDVTNHVKAVHDTGTKKSCSICDKTYSSEIALAGHMKRIHCEERLKCPKCPEILRSPYMKKRHMMLVHDAKQYQFNCDLCSKTFMFLSKLTRHKAMTHFKEKNLTCEICGLKVYNKDILKTHMVNHDDATPFQCEYCDLSFRRKKSWDFHTRTHTNDKRYVCKECGKAFVQLTSLKWHRKKYHPESGASWK